MAHEASATRHGAPAAMSAVTRRDSSAAPPVSAALNRPITLGAASPSSPLIAVGTSTFAAARLKPISTVPTMSSRASPAERMPAPTVSRANALRTAIFVPATRPRVAPSGAAKPKRSSGRPDTNPTMELVKSRSAWTRSITGGRRRLPSGDSPPGLETRRRTQRFAAAEALAAHAKSPWRSLKAASSPDERDVYRRDDRTSRYARTKPEHIRSLSTDHGNHSLRSALQLDPGQQVAPFNGDHGAG